VLDEIEVYQHSNKSIRQYQIEYFWCCIEN
jgi:hypothetical protein